VFNVSLHVCPPLSTSDLHLVPAVLDQLTVIDHSEVVHCATLPRHSHAVSIAHRSSLQQVQLDEQAVTSDLLLTGRDTPFSYHLRSITDAAGCRCTEGCDFISASGVCSRMHADHARCRHCTEAFNWINGIWKARTHSLAVWWNCSTTYSYNAVKFSRAYLPFVWQIYIRFTLKSRLVYWATYEIMEHKLDVLYNWY